MKKSWLTLEDISIGIFGVIGFEFLLDSIFIGEFFVNYRILEGILGAIFIVVAIYLYSRE